MMSVARTVKVDVGVAERERRYPRQLHVIKSEKEREKESTPKVANIEG